MEHRSLLVALCTLAVSASAHAQAGLPVVEVDGIRVDGSIRDWHGAHLTAVGEGSDASMRFVLGHDGRGIYVAAEVRDERMVRSDRPGAEEDAIILTFAAPGRRGRATDVYLFAGVSGRTAASAGRAPVGAARVRALSGVQVVEGPLAHGRGYTLEAFIPFSVVPGGAAHWEQARGSIRLRDVDREAHPEVESEPAFVPVDARHLDALVPLVPSGGASGVLQQFLAARHILAARPTHDLRGDVAGDARPERVTLVAGYVLVSGPGYRDGGGYAYHQLPVDDARAVRSAELTDLTGDGKAELVVVLRQHNAQGERDLWQVLALEGDAPRPAFAIEVRKAIGEGSVEARVRVRRARRGAATIEVRSGRAHGLDEARYRESPAGDAEAMLLPWGPILERTYRWNGRTFAQTGERPNPRYTPPEARAPSRAEAPSEPAPSAPSEDALLAAFRRQRGIPGRARPRFRVHANLAGGAEPESALVFGRQLVVIGPGVHGGTSWLYYEIPAASDADLLSIEAHDVTGDGRGELLVRVRQSFGEVTREVLLVHQLTGEGLPRLLEVEVARSQGRSAIRNEVRARGRLEIRPGRASGWSADTWRFTRDPNDSVAPLLLPWRDHAVRYVLRGGRLVPR